MKQFTLVLFLLASLCAQAEDSCRFEGTQGQITLPEGFKETETEKLVASTEGVVSRREVYNSSSVMELSLSCEVSDSFRARVSYLNNVNFAIVNHVTLPRSAIPNLELRALLTGDVSATVTRRGELHAVGVFLSYCHRTVGDIGLFVEAGAYRAEATLNSEVRIDDGVGESFTLLGPTERRKETVSVMSLGVEYPLTKKVDIILRVFPYSKVNMYLGGLAWRF